MGLISRGKGDAERPGLRLAANSLLVYGVSAGLSSASAGLFVVSLELYRRGNPVTGAFNVAGSVLIIPGIALAVVALLLLGLSFRRLPGELMRAASSPTRRVLVAISIVLWATAFGLLAIAAVSGLLLVVLLKNPPQDLFQNFVFFEGAAAFAFLGALSLPVVTLGRVGLKPLALIAAAFGGVGIMGEVLIQSQASVAPDWLTLGGYPLLNWNLPFGALVAVSAFVMWRAYRSMALDGFQKVSSPQ